MLTVYLALALTNRNESQEFHVLLILIILITTIFFCHSLIRLCMMILHPPSDGDLERQNLPAMVGPGGYANPVQPIRVALARDEEAAGIESPATKLPPPAYGLWRESVVCNLAPRYRKPEVLIRCSELTRIVSFGSAMRQHQKVATLLKSGQPRPIGLHHIYLITASIMW